MSTLNDPRFAKLTRHMLTAYMEEIRTKYRMPGVTDPGVGERYRVPVPPTTKISAVPDYTTSDYTTSVTVSYLVFEKKRFQLSDGDTVRIWWNSEAASEFQKGIQKRADELAMQAMLMLELRYLPY